MNKALIALLASLMPAPALSNMLIDNVNGIQVGADGTIQRFNRLLIDAGLLKF